MFFLCLPNSKIIRGNNLLTYNKKYKKLVPLNSPSVSFNEYGFQSAYFVYYDSYNKTITI